MIAAVDNRGKIYTSLTQFNTDGDVMLMFISRLAMVLSQEDPEWRKNTIWLLDNAAYHKKEDVRKHLIDLGVKVMFSAPYSYKAAPCELFFAYFKQHDLNPDD